MENEKPNIHEELEQVSEISFSLEYDLQQGALDEITIDEAKTQIAEFMKREYEELNPFEEAETIVTVEINEVEVCTNTRTNEIDETGELCKKNTRRRRNIFKKPFEWMVDEAEDFYEKRKKNVVTLLMKFKSYGKSAVQWSIDQAFFKATIDILRLE